jgi:hypothetical protein
MRELFDRACQSGCQSVATLPENYRKEADDSTGFSEVENVLNWVARNDAAVVMGWLVVRLGRSSQHFVITPAKSTIQAYELAV